jgi:hypothetical protein
MRKLAIALAISLLPIFAVPANAGVYECKYRQYKSYTKSGIKYRYKTICRLNGRETNGER